VVSVQSVARRRRLVAHRLFPRGPTWPAVPSFTKSIAIRRTPEQVFAVLDDLEQAPTWIPAIRKVAILTPGMRMGVGFKWRETRRVFGILRMSVVLVVTSHDPPRTWGVTFNDGKVQATSTVDLEATPGGTRVRLVEEVEDLQGKPKRAETMLKTVEKQDADLLERLKVHVEATTEEPPGLAPDPPLASVPAVAEKERATAAKPARAARVAKAKAPSARARPVARKPAKKAAAKRTPGRPK
jgi:uncharacterized protein YndB with AHSA1/START domain